MVSPPNHQFQTKMNKNCSPLIAKVVVDEFILSQRVHSTEIYKLSKIKPNQICHFDEAYNILSSQSMYRKRKP